MIHWTKGVDGNPDPTPAQPQAAPTQNPAPSQSQAVPAPDPDTVAGRNQLVAQAVAARGNGPVVVPDPRVTFVMVLIGLTINS